LHIAFVSAFQVVQDNGPGKGFFSKRTLLLIMPHVGMATDAVQTFAAGVDFVDHTTVTVTAGVFRHSPVVVSDHDGLVKFTRREGQ
jgi:hypothetical protein